MSLQFHNRAHHRTHRSAGSGAAATYTRRESDCARSIISLVAALADSGAIALTNAAVAIEVVPMLDCVDTAGACLRSGARVTVDMLRAGDCVWRVCAFARAVTFASIAICSAVLSPSYQRTVLWITLSRRKNDHVSVCMSYSHEVSHQHHFRTDVVLHYWLQGKDTMHIHIAFESDVKKHGAIRV